jgi:uncharacterized membrane protein YidH (DUF202 family)
VTAPDDPEESDPGLAKERTHLAWTRTAISFAAAGAAILKTHVVPGAIVIGLGLVAWSLRRVFPAGTDTANLRRRLLIVTIVVTAVAVVALTLTIFASGPGFVLR